MHREAFFWFGAGQKENFTGLAIRKASLFWVRLGLAPSAFRPDENSSFTEEWVGRGVNFSRRGGVTVKLRRFFGAGQGSLENFWGRSGPGQPFSPGPGQGGLGRASLV